MDLVYLIEYKNEPGFGGGGGEGGDGGLGGVGGNGGHCYLQLMNDGTAINNPAGFSGVNGIEGRSGPDGTHGNRGKQGEYWIVIGPNIYGSCFQYQIQDFRVMTSGMILEPGKEGVVEAIRVTNVGGMPGPGNLCSVHIR